MMAANAPSSVLKTPGCLFFTVLFIVGIAMILRWELFEERDPPTAEEKRAEELIDGPLPDRVRVAADALREDHVYVDPLLEQLAPKGLSDDGELADAVASSDVPVFVAQLPRSDQDGSGGSYGVLLERLERGVGRDGVYVLADERDLVATSARGPYPSWFDSGSGRFDAELLRALLEELPDESQRYDETRDGAWDKVTNGVYLGVAAVIVLGVLWRLLRRFASGRAKRVGDFG